MMTVSLQLHPPALTSFQRWIGILPSLTADIWKGKAMNITITNSTFKVRKALLSVPRGSKVPDITIHGSFISGDAGIEERDGPAAELVTRFPWHPIIVGAQKIWLRG
jgi:hypothetical protein